MQVSSAPSLCPEHLVLSWHQGAVRKEIGHPTLPCHGSDDTFLNGPFPVHSHISSDFRTVNSEPVRIQYTVKGCSHDSLLSGQPIKLLILDIGAKPKPTIL